MIHPDTELRYLDPVVGHGVFATKRIPRGTIVWAKDPLDRVFSPAEVAALGEAFRPLVEHCTFADEEGRRVLCWDLGRYMNHSCRPTCAGTDFGFEVALRDIEAGEQLTNDYGTLHIEASEGFACRCGEPGCRGAIAPDDGAGGRLAKDLAAALACTAAVPQPLSELVSPEVLAAAYHLVGLPLPSEQARVA
ncbi:MAG: SET domain-containing protein [Polyangiales bacterium]